MSLSVIWVLGEVFKKGFFGLIQLTLGISLGTSIKKILAGLGGKGLQGVERNAKNKGFDPSFHRSSILNVRGQDVQKAASAILD